MKISSKVFARIGAERIIQYTLENDHGMSLRFLTFGARVQQMRLANALQQDPNLLLGWITITDYLKQPGAIGASVGPVFGHGPDGQQNSGRSGWQNWNWYAETAQGPDYVSINFILNLPPGADGQPGARSISVRHQLFNDNRWTIDWEIETTQKIQIRPQVNLALALNADAAKQILNETLTLDNQPVALDPVDQLTTAKTATLQDDAWQVAFQTDAPGMRITTYPEINDSSNFNGIVGQPHIAVGLQPLTTLQNGLLQLEPGSPFTRHSELRLTAR